MPELLKVSIKGTLPNGEVWSVNPIFSTPTEPTLTFDQLDTIASAINAITVPATVLATLSGACAITGVRLEQRERDGSLVGQMEKPRSSPLVGTGTVILPLQTSIVVSLASIYPGGQGRGRLYWPLTAGALGTLNHRYSGTQLSTFLTNFKAYLGLIEAAIVATTTAADLVVWSRTGTAYHTVVKMRAGDVPDVQRRRRDSLVESYSIVDYP